MITGLRALHTVQVTVVLAVKLHKTSKKIMEMSHLREVLLILCSVRSDWIQNWRMADLFERSPIKEE